MTSERDTDLHKAGMESAETRLSSNSLIALDLSYSSSSLEWSNSSDGTSEASDFDVQPSLATVEPYMYEPEHNEPASASEDSKKENENRLGDTEWKGTLSSRS